MTKLRTLLTALAISWSSCIMADDFQYLTVSQTDGEAQFSVSAIQRITFDSTNMNLLLKDGSTQSLPLSSVQKMFFSTETSGIAALGNTKSKIQFTRGMLRADVATGEKIAVFNMKGEQVFSTNESGTYDLSTLVKGVYIVKVGNETKKVVNR